MTSSDAMMYLMVFTLWGAVVVALAMIPAGLLVAAHRLAGSGGLYAASILMAAITISYWLGVFERQTLTMAILFCTPPFAAAAGTIKADVGGGSAIRQTMAAGSAIVLAAAIPALVALMIEGPRSASLMGAAGVALALYLIWRRWMLERRRARQIAAS